ncbi:unnamed protein product [Gadus morhua 'NCC']
MRRPSARGEAAGQLPGGTNKEPMSNGSSALVSLVDSDRKNTGIHPFYEFLICKSAAQLVIPRAVGRGITPAERQPVFGGRRDVLKNTGDVVVVVDEMGNVKFALDSGSEAACSTWLKYVRCAPSFEEQNLAACHLTGDQVSGGPLGQSAARV